MQCMLSGGGGTRHDLAGAPGVRALPLAHLAQMTFASRQAHGSNAVVAARDSVRCANSSSRRAQPPDTPGGGWLAGTENFFVVDRRVAPMEYKQCANRNALNHKQLQGSAGAVAVLHTHSRKLEFHPHVHMAMPACALDADRRLWRTLRASKKGAGYLFNHKALAKVFAAKLLHALREGGLAQPAELPEKWVVDCKGVGSGQNVLVYLGRYLYRGVIQEKDIIACANGRVTYRWRDSESKRMVQRTVSGAEFLRLLMQHVLPRGFRRSRNFGFLHPNSKRLIALLRLLVFRQPTAAPAAPAPRPPWLCSCCGAPMLILGRRIGSPSTLAPRSRAAPTEQLATPGAMA